MVSESLKQVARTFNFSGQMLFAFKIHSLRIGGATSRMAAGEDRDTTKRIGGWSPNSNCDEIYYVNTVLDDGALSISRTCMNILSMEDVSKLVPPELL
jgi:hypothetical protein